MIEMRACRVGRRRSFGPLLVNRWAWSLLLAVQGLEDRPPFLDFGFMPCGKRFGCLLFAWKRLGAVFRKSRPHHGIGQRIDNGGGELVTFLGVRTDSDGRELLEVENQVQPGSGPPMHVHHLQEESLTVQEGRIGYRVPGGPERFAGPGETVTFAPGQMHRFWNAGDGCCAARDMPVLRATSSTS